MSQPAGTVHLPVMMDVARRAGVSHQTVSRVLNAHPNVKPATRDRVLAAINDLGYRRNSVARALVTRRTQMLGVVVFDTTLYGPASTLYGIEQAARDAGYFVSIVSLRRLTPEAVHDAVGYLTDQGVDGLVVIAPERSAAAALDDLPRSLPVVTVEGAHDVGLPVVSVDQLLGARLATEHLLSLGHRTVWHVAGPSEWLEAAGRERGWRDALRAAGAQVPEMLRGDWSPRSGYEAGRVLATRNDLSAVFVANDQMALGLLRAFREAGVRVPEDVSVAGFDDIPEAGYFAPPLTTVRQDFGAVGRSSIQLLIDRLNETAGSEGARVVVPATLVVRASTASPPSGLEHP